MQTALMTYADVVGHVIDYLGGDTGAQSERFARRAVQNAVSDYWSKRTWTIGYRRGRIITTPPYNTGTVTYLVSSGAVPRQLTIAGGTWPTWAAEGNVLMAVPGMVATIPYAIAARVSGTVLQLQSSLAPQSDVTTPTTFYLVQESYPMPVDFGTAGEIVNIGFARTLLYQTPDEFIRQQRVNISPANPFAYTIQWDSRRYGTLVCSFYPSPDASYTMDFSYQRQGRPLNSHGITPVVAYADGSVTVGASSTAVTGTGTNWTPDMVGGVIRFSAQGNPKTPTGPAGTNPFQIQRTVIAYTGPTSIIIDQVTGQALTNVQHSISDPVDLEAGAMTTYFLREVENQARLARRIKPEQFEIKAYQDALRDAFEADSKHHETRMTFGATSSAVRIATMPAGPPIGV